MKYADKQARHFDEEKIKAGQCVIGLQVSAQCDCHMTCFIIGFKCLLMVVQQRNTPCVTAFKPVTFRVHLNANGSLQSEIRRTVFAELVSLALVSQMGTNKCASQAGMTAYGTRRHLYDPKTHTDKPYDQTTISLQMGTNKGASQVRPARLYSLPCWMI